MTRHYHETVYGGGRTAVLRRLIFLNGYGELDSYMIVLIRQALKLLPYAIAKIPTSPLYFRQNSNFTPLLLPKS